MLDPTSGDALARGSVADLARRTIADGRAAIEAELALYKAIAAYRLSGLKLGAPLLIVALFLLQAVLTALLVGLILAVATLVGPGFATLIVSVAGLALVGLVAWLGWRQLATLFAPLPGEEP